MFTQIEKRRYTKEIRNKWMTTHCSDIDGFISAYVEMAEEMQRWKELGIKLDPESGIEDDYAMFYTYDDAVADQEGFKLDLDDDMEDEDEDSFFDEEDEEDDAS